jgi:hypothetical protein
MMWASQPEGITNRGVQYVIWIHIHMNVYEYVCCIIYTYAWYYLYMIYMAGSQPPYMRHNISCTFEIPHTVYNMYVYTSMIICHLLHAFSCCFFVYRAFFVECVTSLRAYDTFFGMTRYVQPKVFSLRQNRDEALSDT